METKETEERGRKDRENVRTKAKKGTQRNMGKKDTYVALQISL